MSIKKMISLRVLSVLVGIIVVLSVGVTANTITIGSVSPNELFLTSRNVFMPSSLFMLQTAKITFPAKMHSDSAILSRIVIKDWGDPDHFAHFSLVNGGPGKKYATIRAESQSSGLLYFTVEFYGYY